MSGFYGANVEELEALAGVFDAEAVHLESWGSSVGSRVRLPIWAGPLAARFRSNWDGEHSRRMRAAVEYLRESAKVLRRNAQEQLRASEAGGVGGGAAYFGAPIPVAPIVFGFWERIRDGSAVALDWVDDRADDLWNAGVATGQWVGDRAEEAWTATVAGAEWAADRYTEAVVAVAVAGAGIAVKTGQAVKSGWNWAVEHGQTVGESWENYGEALWDFGDANVGSVLRGDFPRTTEQVASFLDVLGSAGDAAVNTATLGMVDPNFLDDGEPTATRMGDSTEATVPQDVGDLARGVVDSYKAGDGVVRVTTIDTPDGPRVVVDIPGTETWDPFAGSNPIDIEGNLTTAGGGQSTMTEAVAMAMAQARANGDIPDDAQVMLVGHSQGGMTAAALAADPDFVSQYNVTNMMTMGSPIDSVQVDPRVNTLEVQHQWDVVPLLDLEDTRTAGVGLAVNPLPIGPRIVPVPILVSGNPAGDSANYHNVTLPNPGPASDIVNSHDYNNYKNSLAATNNSEVTDYEEQLRQSGFVGSDRAATTVNYQVGREGR